MISRFLLVHSVFLKSHLGLYLITVNLTGSLIGFSEERSCFHDAWSKIDHYYTLDETNNNCVNKEYILDFGETIKFQNLGNKSDCYGYFVT